MGSLMAGWDAAIWDPKDAVLKRNKSLTKDEIDAYWNFKKKLEEDHLKDISELADQVIQLDSSVKTQERYQRSKSYPPTVAELDDGHEATQIQIPLSTLQENLKLQNLDGWWTRSNWAFLNEPPVTAMEAPSYKYASQYHVANFLKSEPRASTA